MAIAFDAASTATPGTDNPLTWTHTPSGTPKGILVLIADVISTATDDVTTVTYGGVAMTEVTGSPLLKNTIGDPGALHGFFLGSQVPTGAQTVSVGTGGGGFTKAAVSISYTADGNTEIEDTTVNAGITTANASVTLTTTVETAIAGVLFHDSGSLTDITPGASYTEIQEVDLGFSVCGFQRGTSNFAAGSPTCNWTSADFDGAAIIGVAVKDAGGGGGGTSDVVAQVLTKRMLL